MITLLRLIRVWQLRTKWRLAVWELIDRQGMELGRDPEKLEKMLADSLVKLFHEADAVKEGQPGSVSASLK